MKKAIIYNGVVENIIIADNDFTIIGKTLVDITEMTVGIGWMYIDEVFIPPEQIPAQIILDVLSTDAWNIPSDGTTYATVAYTSEETIYFSVNEQSHAVEPIDCVATLEITADAPGPIRVEVKDKQLIITAIEVQI